MRQLNFVFGFVTIFILVLFSLENPEPVTVLLVPSVAEFEAPLCIVLILAMGVGAILTWTVSILSGLQ
ncbi:MAG: LapA family protein, partial [Cyanobacteria bacterium P01_H01_bin.121]